MNDPFQLVGIRPQEAAAPTPKPRQKRPVLSLTVLGLLVLGCLAAPLIAPGDPGYLDLLHTSQAPGGEFLFGTDAMGRDLFRCIWHGGRVSLFIGFLSTLISTAIAVVYGAVSGVSSPGVDSAMMRLTEILLSVPELLTVLFLQAIWGVATPVSIAVIIGLTSWYSIAKVVRTEVRQLRGSEYVIASRAMGGRFAHILGQHLAPNFLSSIMFMVVMNVRSAIVAESTLSFLGMGLPIDTVSWGSMLSLSERALMTGSWWVILIPGAFLVALLLSLTEIGNWLRREGSRRESNL
mgnify:FL=1